MVCERCHGTEPAKTYRVTKGEAEPVKRDLCEGCASITAASFKVSPKPPALVAEEAPAAPATEEAKTKREADAE